MTPAATERTEHYHVLQSLKSRLDEATAYKASLEERLAIQTQRDSLKQFKRLVGILLESGEAAEWMTSVTPDQLCGMMSTNSNKKNSKVVDEESANTAVNRIYQLLVEGKKANSSLVLDANILTRASKRNDLFSAKQCETLQQRAELAEQAQAAEREQLELEARGEQQAKAAHQLLQQRAKAMPCTRGSWVQLQGLQKHPDLNGRSGVFMGIDTASTTERYCIQFLVVMAMALMMKGFERCHSWPRTLHHGISFKPLTCSSNVNRRSGRRHSFSESNNNTCTAE
jgi:hypothetical protein